VLVDGNALITAALGAVIGVVLMYRVPKRQWWAAIGQSAIPLAAVLNYAAQGHAGSSVHIIIAINIVILTIVFVGAAYADYKLRIRKSPSLQCRGDARNV
jgi:general stress protein CsbA